MKISVNEYNLLRLYFLLVGLLCLLKSDQFFLADNVSF